MKKLGELMAEIGFNKNSSEGTQQAFIKHLIRAAEGVYITTPLEKAEIEKNNLPQIYKVTSQPETVKNSEMAGTQLSFDFNEVS